MKTPLMNSTLSYTSNTKHFIKYTGLSISQIRKTVIKKLSIIKECFAYRDYICILSSNNDAFATTAEKVLTLNPHF